jgi:hypothetical protein
MTQKTKGGEGFDASLCSVTFLNRMLNLAAIIGIVGTIVFIPVALVIIPPPDFQTKDNIEKHEPQNPNEESDDGENACEIVKSVDCGSIYIRIHFHGCCCSPVGGIRSGADHRSGEHTLAVNQIGSFYVCIGVTRCLPRERAGSKRDGECR